MKDHELPLKLQTLGATQEPGALNSPAKDKAAIEAEYQKAEVLDERLAEAIADLAQAINPVLSGDSDTNAPKEEFPATGSSQLYYALARHNESLVNKITWLRELTSRVEL